MWCYLFYRKYLTCWYVHCSTERQTTCAVLSSVFFAFNSVTVFYTDALMAELRPVKRVAYYIVSTMVVIR